MELLREQKPSKALEGYNKTDVGILPSDWIVEKLGSISSIKTGPFGSSLHEKDYVSDGTPIITVEHLGELGIVHRNMPMVSDNDRNRLSAYALLTYDIVFSRVGSVDRNSLVTEKEEGWLFSGRLLRIRLNLKSLSPKYLSYYLHYEPTRQRIRAVAVGQTMASLNTQILKEFEVAFPPTLEEQNAIASALSNVDEVINNLDKLITKKKAIKQGAMQQLLKSPKQGGKRLLGFEGEWKAKKIGDVLKVRHGKSQHDIINPNGKYPILATGGQIGKTDHFLYNKPSVLIGRKGTIDKPYYMDTPFWTVDTLFYTEISPVALPKYIYYLFRLIDWYSYNEASGVPSLNAATIERIEVSMPPTIEEQIAIATILSDMDAEIENLEKKRVKYQRIKQGMMQELLTGKTRLV